MSEYSSFLKKFRFGEDNSIKWTSANQKRTKIEELTTTHIHNILNCFQKGTIPSDYDGGSEGWERILNKELKRRKDNGKG